MVTYATREDVKAALDSAETARNNTQIDRALEAASRSIEALTLRTFHPQTDTRYFDWPDRNGSRPWRLWLNRDELISVTALVVAGDAIAPTDYFLEPANSGPPYTHVEIDLASSAAFSSGDTHQRAIAITGIYGYDYTTETVGELGSNLDADEADTATVNWSRNVGVGDLLLIDSELLAVTERSMVDTTQNLGSDLDASMADTTVAVSNGTAFLIDQVILIDAERMRVVDIAGNNLIVRRAWDGSTLAAHTTSADVYALAGIDIERAQLGTTLAAHTTGDTISRLLVPGPIHSLCVAEAVNTLQQDGAGWGRQVASGESTHDPAGADLPGLRAEVRKQYGRRARVAAI